LFCVIIKSIGKEDTNKTQQAKIEALKTAMAQIEKQYGKGSIMKLGQSVTKIPVDVIPTGSIGLDLALGVGGFPRGRVIEIFGPEASGKTTLALHAISEAQKKGGTVAFVDAEHGLDPLWAQTIGVNLDDLLLSQPDTGEQALEIVETLVRSGAVDLIVVDSVAALVPRAEIEGEMGEAMIGVQARLMSQAMRKLAGAISKSKTVVLFTNQLRMKIGVMFGNPEVTPGGRALKFYSSVRLDTRKTGNIKDPQGNIVGSRHRVKVVKNKVAPPFKMAEIDIFPDRGISHEGELIDLGLELGTLSKSGAFIKCGEEFLGQGREAARKFLGDNPKVAKKIGDQILKQAKSGKTAD
jgi:recombination protein RecA